MVDLLKDLAYYKIDGKKFQFRAIVKQMPGEWMRGAVASFECEDGTVYEAYIKPLKYNLVIPKPLPFEIKFISGRWYADLEMLYY